MQKKKLIAVIAACIFAIGCFGGCGSKEEAKDEVLNPAADDPTITDHDWGLDIWNTAINKLYDDGSVKKSKIEDTEYFQFDSNGEISFDSLSTKEKYTSDFKLDGKCIWGCYSVDNYFSIHKRQTDDAETPLYYYSGGGDDTPVDMFANTRGECKYLIIHTGLTSRIDEDFYSGGADRRSISTEVIVLDAVSKEVVHIEHIGVDTPGAITQSNTGDVFISEAFDYMKGLGK